MNPIVKDKLLIVGAFPEPGSSIIGGIVTSCKTLLDSDFSEFFDLILIDSTQISNPPPPFLHRFVRAFKRFMFYFFSLLLNRPKAIVLFASSGASIAEKGLMAWIARLLQIPTFIFPRGGKLIDIVISNRWQRFWIVPAMQGAKYFLCQGPKWERFALEVLRYNPNNIEIIKNWTATKELLQIGSNRELHHRKEKYRILFLGWLEREKGVFELLEASLSLSRRHNFSLTFAGDGNAEQNAKAFTSKNNLDAFVHFAGWVNGRQKLELLANSDILILPSWAEGFPNAIIEAMASKMAVIVTSVGNIPEILNNRDQVLIIKSKDPISLERAIEELLMDDDLRIKLAENGFNFANDNFSTQKGVDRLKQIIKGVIS